MDAALADSRASCTFSVSHAARRHGGHKVGAEQTISRKDLLSGSGAESRRMLNNQQEEEFINYTNHLCERRLPPIAQIVANIAQKLCGRKLSKNRSSRFVVRDKHRLDARHLSTLDLATPQS